MGPRTARIIAAIPDLLDRVAAAVRVGVEGLADVDMDFEDWFQYGHDRGWMSDVFCPIHSPLPLTAEETQHVVETGSYNDLCVPAIRLWADLL